jgi:hypothetical protein
VITEYIKAVSQKLEAKRVERDRNKLSNTNIKEANK